MHTRMHAHTHTCTHTPTTPPQHTHTQVRSYPYTITSDYAETENDFQINGYVDYAADVQRLSSSSSATSAPPPLVWSMHMTSNATYNRTNDYVYNIDEGATSERFSAAGCYEQSFSSENGYVTLATEESECTKATTASLQASLCGEYDACAPRPMNISSSPSVASSSSRKLVGPLLFRSPHHGASRHRAAAP